MKTKWIALFCAAALLITLCACGKQTQDPDPGAADETTTNETETEEAGTPEPVTADMSGWTWENMELDCYGYDTGGVDCYLSFAYPSVFTTAENNDDGEQYRGCYYNPEKADATANESPYGIYAYFMQGGYGAVKQSFEEDVAGGLTERELGGRTVLFGELPQDENTGSHAFVYYTAYSEDEWARIWVILCDPEADGAFRKSFEDSIRFTKE